MSIIFTIDYMFLYTHWRHPADKPMVTDWFRDLLRKRQRAQLSGDLNQANILRNKVNRAASKIPQNHGNNTRGYAVYF